MKCQKIHMLRNILSQVESQTIYAGGDLRYYLNQWFSPGGDFAPPHPLPRGHLTVPEIFWLLQWRENATGDWTGEATDAAQDRTQGGSWTKELLAQTAKSAEVRKL